MPRFYVGAAVLVVLLVVVLVGLVVLVRRLADLREALQRRVVDDREHARRSASRLERQIHADACAHSRELAALADYLVAELRPVRGLETRSAPGGEQ